MAHSSDDEYSDLSEQDGDPLYTTGVPTGDEFDQAPVALVVMSIEMDVEEVARARTCRGKRRSKVNAVHRGGAGQQRGRYQVRPTSGDEADVHTTRKTEENRRIAWFG